MPVLIHEVRSPIKHTQHLIKYLGNQKMPIGYCSLESEDESKLVDNKCTRHNAKQKKYKHGFLFLVSDHFFNRALWIPNGLKIEIIEYLAVTNNVLLNQRKDKWEWLIMKVGASKICNESNHMKIAFNQKKQLLLPCCYQRCLIESAKG